MVSPVESRRSPKPKSGPSSPIVFLGTCIAGVAVVFLYSYLNSTSDFSSSSLEALESVPSLISRRHDKYLYWGTRIDCPGKHCQSCEGLAHQESSLRCALEEALFLQRTFVMPSRMCINPIHNNKGFFHQSDNASAEEKFAECKNRNNRSALILPYSFLPSMAAKKLRNAADKIKEILGDYDAIHVRRGDRLKTRRDRNGVERTLSPHLDRDTRPEFILRRIEKWVPPGRTLYIASNERTPGFFSPLSVRYKLAYSSNYSRLLETLIENNYQLFMIERLILMGAKTFIRTFKEDDTDLYLTDDPKKNTKNWQIPVYTMDEKGR
ncbi:hypothetical protein ACLB2K_013142 [Fragaria x ananassa]